jgi:hypothetical protein
VGLLLQYLTDLAGAAKPSVVAKSKRPLLNPSTPPDSRVPAKPKARALRKA